MKLPISTDDIIDMWSKDCKVDQSNLGSELARIPELHAKYLKIHSYHSLVVKNLAIKYNVLRKTKYEYLSGDLNNPQDLKEHGLPPMNKRILKVDISLHMDADPELNKLLAQRQLNQEVVDVCTEILKQISNRTYQISTIVKWKQFQDGVL